MPDKKRVRELGNSIRESLDRWNEMYRNGGSDPFWEDGVNLELIRNHIIYYKKQCEDELLPEQYPPEYNLDLPPVVDPKYMARADEIKEHAIRSLEVYIADANYQYLSENVHRLTKKQNDETHIANVLRYVSGLQSSIRNNDFVGMRRHEYPALYTESFSDCRKKVERILGTEKVLPQGQLSLSDLFEI